MSLHVKHKSLIAFLASTAILFATLFAVTALELKDRNLTLKSQDSSQYLRAEEAIIVIPQVEEFAVSPNDSDPTEEEAEDSVAGKETEQEPEEEILKIERTLFEYIEVADSCNHNFENDCLNVRSGPGTDFPVVNRLRQGTVLKVGGKVERNGNEWFKIDFDEWLRYPDRVSGDWYVSADYVNILLNEGPLEIVNGEKTETKKRIEVDRSEQMLRAYEGDELFMEETISTGLELTPTPRGTFTIFRKTPSRYMQGPIPGISSKYWDLPGVPWNLYFTQQGAIIHGAYWHNDFGQRASAGCVNMSPEKARELYNWADIGTKVIIAD